MADEIYLCDRCGCAQNPLRSPDGDVALGLVGLCDDCVTEEHLLAYRQKGRVTEVLMHKAWKLRSARHNEPKPEVYATWVPNTAMELARDAEAIEALIGMFRLCVWEGRTMRVGLLGIWQRTVSQLREAHVVCGGTVLHLVHRSCGEMTARLSQQDGQFIKFVLHPYLERDPRKAQAPDVCATMHALRAMFAEVAYLLATGGPELVDGPPPDEDTDEAPAKRKGRKRKSKASGAKK